MRQIALALLIFSMPLSAEIYHEIDTARHFCCNLSNKHHNRILIEQGRVKKVIFPEEKLFVQMEEVSGQVFVQPKFLSEDPIVISVITQEGIVQDIEITFTDCSSQVVVLKNPVENGLPTCCQVCCQVNQDHACCSLEETVNCLLRREIPGEYSSIPFRRCVFEPKSGFSAKLVGKLKSLADTLYLYEITNTTFFRRKILEKEIACQGSLWVFLEKNCLCSKEKVLAVVAVQNE